MSIVNKIEIVDKETNTKATYVLQEDARSDEDYNQYEELLKFLINGFLKLSKFSLYVVVNLLKLFIKVIEGLFLNEYEPFKKVLCTKDNFLNRIAEKEINKHEVNYTVAKLTRHTFEFERSELYSTTYKYLQEKLKDFADNNVAINHDIYKDILTKVDILTVEADKKALQEGYHYAKLTKYKLSNEEVYNDFLQYQIMRGEGCGKINKEYRASGD